MTTRRALGLVVVVSALFRLAWAAAIGPGNDEAYHYLFTVHRDWSYFDHPPMVAVVERLGIALAGGVASVFSLRLGFVALFAGSTWLIARLAGRRYGPHAGLFAAVALNVTAYHSLAAGTFALPDGPLLFFWLLTLDRLAAAFDAPSRLGPWVGVGLAWGGAMLSKYHAVFLPAGAVLYLLVEPSARQCVRRPGPYVAAAIGFLVFAPVIAWNAAHGWASFAFQGGRAIHGWQLQPQNLAIALLGPIVYLFPWVWLGLVQDLFRQGRCLFGGMGDRFLVSLAVVPLAAFAVLALVRPVLPHWTLVGFLSLFPLLGHEWAERWARNPFRGSRRLALIATAPLAVAGLAILEARTGLIQVGRRGGVGLVRVSRDPTVEMTGWDRVAEELGRRGLLGRPGTFLFTSTWYTSGQLAFATRGSGTPVLCYNARGDARSFAFWSRPADWVGYDGILVALNGRSGEPDCYDRWFSRIEPIGEFAVTRAGSPIRQVRLFHCVRQTAPFPFDHLGSPVPKDWATAERSTADKRPEPGG
jgi:hypothetical protein